MKLPASLLIAAALAASCLSVFAQGEKPSPGPGAPAAAAAVPAPLFVKADLAQGQARYTALCAACHGADGNSGTPANPKLAQQHPEYLIKQLQDFKSGRRPSPIMQPIAAQLSEADMRNVSAWVMANQAKAGFARDPQLVSVGERIYRGGIADRQIAACAGCHSPNGAGIPSQYPRLSGQHADYTAAQLNAFRDDSRKNSPQMTQIAAKLNDREIRAVSDYIAGLR